MYMRLKGDRWYLQKKVKGKFKGYSLKAHKDDLATAYKNLGIMLDRLERGDDPGAGRWKVSKINYTPKSERERGIMRGPLIDWFGGMRVEEITDQVVQDYVDSRGKPKSTLDKELRVLKNICKVVCENFVLPEVVIRNKGKKTTKALTTVQVRAVVDQMRKEVGKYADQYLHVFMLLAWTGMDVKDAVYLRWEFIEDGWIVRTRFKTGNPNPVPICKPLEDMFSRIVCSQDDGFVFHGITPDSTTTAIRRAFKKAGVKGSARSLRHYAASFMASNGAPDSVIGQALGHSKGSRCTALYIHASEEDLKKAYKPFDQVAL